MLSRFETNRKTRRKHVENEQGPIISNSTGCAHKITDGPRVEGIVPNLRRMTPVRRMRLNVVFVVRVESAS